ncbi:MAG: DNA recombination protein RmuC [Phycisphaerales bacterium]|nr:DNA recombination protein RmuC [Phycisphaerales bacterium]
MAETLAIVFLVLFLLTLALAAWLAVGRSRLALAAARVQEELRHGQAALDRIEQDRRAAAERAERLAVELSQASQRVAALEARQDADERAHQQRLADLQAARQQLTDQFKAISSDILKDNNARAAEHFDQRRKAIDEMIKPMRESLERYEKMLGAIEKDRAASHTRLHEQIEYMKQTGETLRRETSQLTLALKGSQTRGRWGEFQLRRIVELAGLAEHIDYVEQPSLEAAGGARQRPDMIVHLPEGRCIVVDAKAVIDAYQDAIGAETDEARSAALTRHARHVREQVVSLGGKAYWEQFDHAPDFVVMFLPGESHFAEAVRVDHTLFDDAMARNVLIATPMTLMALLKSVAYGWRQESLAENAREIMNLGCEMHQRLCTLCEHAGKVGDGLDRAMRSYNAFVGSLESQAIVQARRFEALGVKSSKQVAEATLIETQPREFRRLAADADAAVKNGGSESI